MLPRGRSLFPPLGERHPLHLKWLRPSIRTVPFLRHTNKHETQREGLRVCVWVCVCVCVFRGSKVAVCVWNEQRFPYRGFKWSHCEERGSSQRGTEDETEKVAFVFFRAREVLQTKSGRVRRWGKVRKKLKMKTENKDIDRTRHQERSFKQVEMWKL